MNKTLALALAASGLAYVRPARAENPAPLQDLMARTSIGSMPAFTRTTNANIPPQAQSALDGAGRTHLNYLFLKTTRNWAEI